MLFLLAAGRCGSIVRGPHAGPAEVRPRVTGRRPASFRVCPAVLRRVGGSARLAGVEASEEIRRVFERWYAAVRVGDADAVLARLSEHPGTLLVGSDPNEWWQGDARAVFGRQLEEMSAHPITSEKIDAWEEDSFGWASGKLMIDWIGTSHEARFTCVLHLERGDWKIVQYHLSLPQSNEAIGLTLTTTLEQLEQTLQRAQPDLTASVAVDGTVTIIFTDIVDSTIMLSRLGDHAWLDVIRRHNALIEELTAAQGGTVVETQGDGSMLAFSSARRAVACAQAIQQGIERAFADSSPPIRVRIGIHTGDALQEAEHFFGTTVHYAARVASQALGGEVLVSSLVHDLVTSGASNLTFLEGREVELKGLEGQHRLYAVTPS
jgi:adenylate cyclase